MAALSLIYRQSDGVRLLMRDCDIEWQLLADISTAAENLGDEQVMEMR
jgi:hypothetical protein